MIAARIARARGLVGGATLDNQDLTGWEMYSLPLASGADNFKAASAPSTGPAFYHATFTLNQLGGSFPRSAQLELWRGVGQRAINLGRFWDHGGLRSLFVPSEWLKQGQNDITVLELHDAPKIPEIAGGTQIIEDAGGAFPGKQFSGSPRRLLILKFYNESTPSFRFPQNNFAWFVPCSA